MKVYAEWIVRLGCFRLFAENSPHSTVGYADSLAEAQECGYVIESVTGTLDAINYNRFGVPTATITWNQPPKPFTVTEHFGSLTEAYRKMKELVENGILDDVHKLFS